MPRSTARDAYLSPYGSILGIPVALVGLGWFVAILLLQVSAGLTGVPDRENVPGYFCPFDCGLGVCALSGLRRFFVLHTVCLLCLTAALCIIAIFVLSGIATAFSVPSHGEASACATARHCAIQSAFLVFTTQVSRTT
jgi:uncharacterized membrane protein